jgi:hypothetical protein
VTGPRYTKDAQQELMERSLTNVRALVDKIEAEEAAQRRTQRWVLISLAVVSLALVAVVVIGLSAKKPPPNVAKPDAVAPK